MAESILTGRKIIAVDCGPDISEIVEKEILRVCPKCKFDQATTYGEGVKMVK